MSITRHFHTITFDISSYDAIDMRAETYRYCYIFILERHDTY